VKTVTIHISDKVIAELNRHMTIKYISGAAHGVSDAFIAKVTEAIERGATEVDVKLKEEKG
jgi:hypothetical protein